MPGTGSNHDQNTTTNHNHNEHARKELRRQHRLRIESSGRERTSSPDHPVHEESIITTVREEDEELLDVDRPSNQLQQLLGDVKKAPKINGTASHGGRSPAAGVEYLTEEGKRQKSGQNVIRQLWDSVWLRRSRRQVGHSGHNGVVWDDSEKASKRSISELQDGFNFQTVVDLDHNQKIELTFYGYRQSVLKSILYYLILVLTGGFMALVFHWNQHWGLYVRRKRCPLLSAAFMLIVEKYVHTETSHHDAVTKDALQQEEEQEHEVFYVETVHRVEVEEVKEQYLKERRRGVDKLAEREPHLSEDAIKEKWFDRFLKRACLFERPEVEVKPSAEELSHMSKSLDTATTLVMDGAAASDEKKIEEIRIHEHFLRFPHFSVHFDNGIFEVLNELRFFRYKQLRYVWNEKESRFVKIMGLDNNIPNKLLQPQHGLSIAEQMSRRIVYGLNKIEIPMNSTFQLIYLEFLNPFYVFQIFSCVLWFFYNYYYYACVIILMSAFGITLSVIQTKQNQNSLYQKVTDANKSQSCNVLIVLEEDVDEEEERKEGTGSEAPSRKTSRNESARESGQSRTRNNSEREGDDTEAPAKARKSARGMELLKQLFIVPRSGGGKKKRRKRRHTRTSTRSGRSDESESESGSESSSASSDSEFENAEDYLERPVGSARRSKRDSRKRYQFRQQQMKYLVPGDVIEIPSNGCVIQCDIVLLSGNCIMDESMLTGECVPVTKTPLLKSAAFIFNQKDYSRHILYAGTKLIQTRYIGGERVLGMVINVGIKTAKGDLIRSILYPPPVDYKFEQDSFKFIKLLGMVAFVGFLYTVVTKVTRGISIGKIAVESLDLITIAVPPALPAAMSVGRMYAQKRLKKKDVYCISPRSINVSGSVDLVCFDKTGTLTEDGLDMWAVVPVEKEEVPIVTGRGTSSAVDSPAKSEVSEKTADTETPSSVEGGTSSTQTQISFTPPVINPKTLPMDHPLLHCMVTCHSITQMDGAMRGDPLDLKMFESTGWILQEPENVPDGHKYDLLFPTIVRPGDNIVAGKKNGTMEGGGGDPLGTDRSLSDDLPMNPLDLEDSGGILHSTASTNDLDMMLSAAPLQIGIIREFPFSSSLQRMSVITRRLDDTHFKIFAKGAPEKIYNLCDKRTVPEHFNSILNSYARQGYRIIALAYNTLPAKYTITKVQKCAREVVEKNLTFLGFCVLENRLKEDTKAVIGSLADACIRTVMVTGDNILTAISVAKNCRMIKNGERVIHIDKTAAAVASPQSSQSGGGEAQSQGGDELGSNSVFEDLQKSPRNPYADLQFSVINYEDQLLDGAAAGERKAYTCIDVEKEVESGALRDCHFAVDGNTYKVIMEEYADLSRVLLARGTIFARMSPDLKQHLVGELQRSDYYVAMCGDGANDCGALKIAHCGISLSDSEASVASPFTSKQSNISCVLDVIKEGRAALVTSFGIFKFMAAYSLVQFISVMILYSIDTNLTDIQFLYIDLVLISSFAFFFGKTKSTKKRLTKEVPENSLVARLTILSIFFQILIMATIQAMALVTVRNQSWFIPFSEIYASDGNGSVAQLAMARPHFFNHMRQPESPALMATNGTGDPLSIGLMPTASDPSYSSSALLSKDTGGGSGAGQAIGDPMACYENFSVFLVSAFQYIILVLIFSRGAPYREPLRTNYGLLVAILVNIAFIIWLVFYPPQALVNFFELFEPPWPPEEDGYSGLQFRFLLFAMICANFMLSVFVEKVLLERGWICGQDRVRDKPFKLEGEKSRRKRLWERVTFAPTEQKKFQYYDHIIGAQVAPLIWGAVSEGKGGPPAKCAENRP